MVYTRTRNTRNTPERQFWIDAGINSSTTVPPVFESLEVVTSVVVGSLNSSVLDLVS